LDVENTHIFVSYREEIILHFSPTGEVISLTYTPLISPLAPKTCETLQIPDDKNKKLEFSTSVSYELSFAGMMTPLILPSSRPPAQGLKFFPSARVEGSPLEEAKMAAQNQSFLRKYWYVVLPLMIMMLTGGGEPMEGRGEGGGGADADASAAAASRPRRGKRD